MSKASSQAVAATKEHPSSTVTGFIDAIADDRIFGWAWDPQRPAARIPIRVEVEGKPITAAIADQAREDLTSNGVGDGAHSFEVLIPRGTAPDKIHVFAICPQTGESQELTHRPIDKSLGVVPFSDELRGTAHALVRSQRLLSGRVQSLAEALETLRSDQVAKASEGSVSSRLNALEVAVARTDGLLRDHAALIDELKRQPKDHISRVIACAAAAAAGGAFLLALLH